MKLLSPRRAVAIAAPLALAVPLAGLIMAGPAAAASNYTGPTIGQYDHVTAPPLSAADQQRTDAKMAAVRKAMAARALSPNTTTAKTLNVSYQVQTDPTWCGPTTLAIILGYKGWGWSGSQATQQADAASLLGVPHNGDGTPWQGSDNVPTGGVWESSYPMQDALNYRDHLKTGNTFWAVSALPGSPSSTQITNYKNQLTADIDTGYPLANNEYAAPGYGIGKQPSNEWIMHWFASNGYSSSGSTVVFADPGWGGGSQSTDTVHNVVVSLGGRGYMW